MLPLNRKQSVDLQSKPADWFLQNGGVGRQWVKNGP